MDIVTIGDALVCMNPMTQGPLQFVNLFEKKVGGAELNVAIGCARLGLHTGWISNVGDDPFGKHVISFVKGQGIDTQCVQTIENYPTSVYFKEVLNSDMINSYYYREKSPTSQMKIGDIDEAYFIKSKVFHVSGVFPAVCESNRQIVKDLLKIAKANNMLVTFDTNIRLKLWSKEEAITTIKSYLQYVDVLFIGQEEAQILFNTDDINEIKTMCAPYQISHIVLKLGEQGAVVIKDDEKCKRSPLYKASVVDVIGAGDGFAAGYLYSLLQGWNLETSLDFANAVASYVISVPGDNEGLPTLQQVEVLMGKREHIAR